MTELELNLALDGLVAAAEAKGSLVEMNEMALAFGLGGIARRAVLIAGCDESIEGIRQLIIEKCAAVVA